MEVNLEYSTKDAIRDAIEVFEERFGVGCDAVRARRRVDGTPELHHWVGRIHM